MFLIYGTCSHLVYARCSLLNRKAKDITVARSRCVEPGQDGEHCGLPRAVVAKQARDLARVEGEVEVVDRHLLHASGAVPIQRGGGVINVTQLPGLRGGKPLGTSG